MCVMFALGLTRKTAATKTTTTAFATAAGAPTATTTIAASVATTTAPFAFSHEIDAGACGVGLALTAALCFVTKGVDTALCAQVCIGTGLKVVVVMTRRTRFVVARRAWTVVAWLSIVLTRWTVALWTIAVSVAVVV